MLREGQATRNKYRAEKILLADGGASNDRLRWQATTAAGGDRDQRGIGEELLGMEHRILLGVAPKSPATGDITPIPSTEHRRRPD